MNLSIERIRDCETVESFCQEWNSFANHCPFLRTEWLGNWWRQFGAAKSRRELFVLIVFNDAEEVIGFAPWYLEHSSFGYKAIKLLGTNIKSHPAILCSPSNLASIAARVTNWLVQVSNDPNISSGNSWDYLHLEGIDLDDSAVSAIQHNLAKRNLTLQTTPNSNLLMKVGAGENDERFVLLSSNSSRQTIGNCNRKSQTSDVRFKVIDSRQELIDNWSTFVDLHCQQSQHCGKEGRFADPAYEFFLFDAAKELSKVDLIELVFAVKDDRQIAGQLCFLSPETTYIFESGMNPEFNAGEVENMMNAFVTNRAFERGANICQMNSTTKFDKYRAAHEHHLHDLFVVAPRRAAALGYQIKRSTDWCLDAIKKTLRV